MLYVLCVFHGKLQYDVCFVHIKEKVGEKRSRVGTHSIRVEYGICFLSLNTDFVGSTNTINLCFILLTIYISIPVSGCVGRGPSVLISPGPINIIALLQNKKP
jgi:hypothetical protein